MGSGCGNPIADKSFVLRATPRPGGTSREVSYSVRAYHTPSGRKSKYPFRELLKNENRKVFFIVVDPTITRIRVSCPIERKDASGKVIYDIRTKYVSQLDILHKFVSLLEWPENQDIMKRVDAIHFIVTKADTLGEERQAKAKELLLEQYVSAVEQIKNCCRYSKRINYSTDYSPYVFTFSLGKFYLGNVFEYNSSDSIKMIDALRYMIYPPRKKNILNRELW